MQAIDTGSRRIDSGRFVLFVFRFRETGDAFNTSKWFEIISLFARYKLVQAMRVARVQQTLGSKRAWGCSVRQAKP